MQRRKHRKDHNHGKSGWVGGNPRYGKAKGFQKGQRAKDRTRTVKSFNNTTKE